MKIRVINNELPLYNKEIKVKNINFDMVGVVDNGEVLTFKMEDVQLLPQTKYEGLISKYKDILKVKLNSEISPAFYAALIDCIEQRIEDKLERLEVLEDNYKISKRGIWEKKLVIVVNNAIPLEVAIVAAKYSEEFNITLKDIGLQAFIEGSSENIKRIKKEIEEKQKSMERYKSSLKEVLRNSVPAGTEESDKLIGGW